MGYLLLIPWRKFYHNPKTLLTPHVKPGMKVLDFGCAMGFFSLPLARLAGNQGRIYCADIQQKMIESLIKRARKAGLADRLEPRLLNDLKVLDDLADTIDFAFLFAVVHEVPDKKALFDTMGLVVKSGGLLLFAEPRGHVTKDEFESSLNLAIHAGFVRKEILTVKGSHAALLTKA
jgi:ubiquinone/menaquinone biosynthesis C-methylase UbiE